MNLDLAIICPVLNCAKYTKAFLEQVVKFTDHPIIIIDNNSTDSTPAIVAPHVKSGRVLYIKNTQNAGVSRSWNQGIVLAKNKYHSKTFFIPNNDVIIRRDTLPRMYDILGISDYLLVSALDVKSKCQTVHDFEFFPLPLLPLLKEAPDFSCFMMNVETIEKVGWFDEEFYPAYFEDNDYHRRINLAGYKAVTSNKIPYYHYGSMTIKEGAEIKRLTNANYLHNKAYYKKKWGGDPGNEVFDTPFNK